MFVEQWITLQLLVIVALTDPEKKKEIITFAVALVIVSQRGHESKTLKLNNTDRDKNKPEITFSLKIFPG